MTVVAVCVFISILNIILCTYAGERHIKQLNVKCGNFNSGCKWVGELRSYEDHLTKCQHEFIDCPYSCGKKLPREDNAVLHHTQDVCPNRVVKCKYCEKEDTQWVILGDHQLSCPKFKVVCPNVGCTTFVARMQTSKHRTTCPYETIHCKHDNIGCTTTVLRKDRASHENNHELHLSLAIHTISRLQVQVKSVESSSLEYSVFKMPNYSTYQKQRKIFYSPPFYSHPGGYKMCIKINVSGSVTNEAEFDTFISVYVFFMPGHNDDNLSWPFWGDVKIELLNQEEDRNHHIQSITYKTSKDDGDNKRVVDRRLGASGFGKPKYISHSKLAQNPQYTKDNSLYFRITVIPRQVPKPWLTCTV